MNLHLILALSFISLALIGCSGDDHDHSASNTETADVQASVYETSAAFREQLNDALLSYFELKDALVESDAEQASVRARAFQESLNEVDHSNLSNEALTIWETNRETMDEETSRIAGLSDVEEQREAFDPLSMALIQSVEAFGPFENAVYQQTCPMVGDGSADWLSSSEEIMNPYHGDRMLNCGGIVRTF